MNSNFYKTNEDKHILLTVLFLFSTQIVSQSDPKNTKQCGTFRKPFFGWIASCNETFSPTLCLNQGPHCAYCFDDDNKKCGYAEELTKECTNSYSEIPQRFCHKGSDSPKSCLHSGSSCTWCKDFGFKRNRCNVKARHEINGCVEVEIANQIKINKTHKTASHSQSQKNHGFDLSQVEIWLRPGESVPLRFSFTEPKKYPVDLYLVMDFSYSMRSVIQNVKNVIGDIFQSFSVDDDVRVGVSQFIDKVAAPMTDMTYYQSEITPFRRADGFLPNPPRLFENIASLSKDQNEVFSKIEPMLVSANVDGPEAALSAMIQSTVCNATIKWRDEALHVLLVITESWFHHAGDGIAKLAGFENHLNDLDCHMNDKGLYRFGGHQDYPSVSQVRKVLLNTSTIPVFAVRSELLDNYKSLQKQHFSSGSVAELDNHQETILKIIKTAIQDVKQTQQLNIISTDDENNEICDGFSAQRKYANPRQKRQAHESVINLEKSFDRPLYNVWPGEEIDYTVNFAVSDTACNSQNTNEIKYVIKTSRFPDQIDVKVNLVCDFECMSVEPILLAAECSFQGSLQCGLCTCLPGFYGPTCFEQVEPCSDLKCSGRGVSYTNDVSFSGCKCDQNINSVVYGNCCQCDEERCPVNMFGKTCSENGECRCDEATGDMYCECATGFAGTPDCSCAQSKISCIAIGDGQVCSGRGACLCGSCTCDDGWAGPFCEICTSNCVTCASFADCVVRVVNLEDEFEDADYSECPDNFQIVGHIDEDKGNSGIEKLCVLPAKETDCKYYYTLVFNPISKVKELYEVEEDARCRVGFFVFWIRWIIIILLCLILLCCCGALCFMQRKRKFLENVRDWEDLGTISLLGEKSSIRQNSKDISAEEMKADTSSTRNDYKHKEFKASSTSLDVDSMKIDSKPNSVNSMINSRMDSITEKPIEKKISDIPKEIKRRSLGILDRKLSSVVKKSSDEHNDTRELLESSSSYSNDEEKHANTSLYTNANSGMSNSSKKQSDSQNKPYPVQPFFDTKSRVNKENHTLLYSRSVQSSLLPSLTEVSEETMKPPHPDKFFTSKQASDVPDLPSLLLDSLIFSDENRLKSSVSLPPIPPRTHRMSTVCKPDLVGQSSLIIKSTLASNTHALSTNTLNESIPSLDTDSSESIPEPVLKEAEKKIHSYHHSSLKDLSVIESVGNASLTDSKGPKKLSENSGKISESKIRVSQTGEITDEFENHKPESNNQCDNDNGFTLFMTEALGSEDSYRSQSAFSDSSPYPVINYDSASETTKMIQLINGDNFIESVKPYEYRGNLISEEDGSVKTHIQFSASENYSEVKHPNNNDYKNCPDNNESRTLVSEKRSTSKTDTTLENEMASETFSGNDNGSRSSYFSKASSIGDVFEKSQKTTASQNLQTSVDISTTTTLTPSQTSPVSQNLPPSIDFLSSSVDHNLQRCF